jgi:hypothetical protein
MKTTELILLICGGTLFLCSLVFMFMLFKKDKPITKMIWFMLLSFIMMGFSVISEANIVGLVEYKKQEELSEVEFLTEALAKCPENEEIKDKLTKKLDKFEQEDEKEEVPAKPEEVKKIANAYLTLGNEQKVISYSERILSKDTSNQVAKDLNKVAKIQQMIKALPDYKEDKRALAQKITTGIKDLQTSSNIQEEQLVNLKNMYKQTVIDMRNTGRQ